MLENLNDRISFIVLMFFPVAICSVLILKVWKSRKATIRANREQYFREW